MNKSSEAEQIQWCVKYNKTRLQFVRMMKTSTTSIGAARSTSNSQDNNKLKKSISSTYHSKTKTVSSNTTNNMLYSLKQNRTKTNSHSNKKNNLSCHSNKSLKTLAESTTHLNIDSTKKNIKKVEPNTATNQKGGTTVNVKSMKQRAIGKGLNESTIQPNMKIQSKIHAEKENVGDYMKKSKNVTKELFVPMKKNKPERDTCDQSLLDFSMTVGNKGELHLNQFEVGRKLGKGRFGDVFMARDIRTGFVLAIKMINKREVREAGMEAQVTQEIKIQLFSNHPNVLKLYGFFHDEKKIYLLLELATHGCLFKEIRQKGRLEENLGSFYFRQVTSGVRYLHSLYVIHRDIKPENILNCFSVLKICDFGWAAYSPLYQRQTFCGTLDYVPPQIVTGQFYDDKADVWCLGVLCYELCTGRAPFESRTDQNETYEKILKVNIDFPLYLSSLLVDFIGHILTRDPSRRMQLSDVEGHEWMRKYENQPGRMIRKQIWDVWMHLCRLE